jgi:hypothetical protein
MATCGCGLPARCCQPAVAGKVIYADLWGQLSTHLDQQALFTQSSVHDATTTSFPLSKHTGGDDTPPIFSGLHVYLQLIWEVGLPPLLWSFPLTTAFTSFLASDCWACAVAPAGWHACLQLTWEMGLPPCSVEFSFLCHSHRLSHSWLLGTPVLSGQDQLVYLQFWEGFPSPHFGAQGTPPSLLRVFIVLGLSRRLCRSGPGMSVGVPRPI